MDDNLINTNENINVWSSVLSQSIHILNLIQNPNWNGGLHVINYINILG